MKAFLQQTITVFQAASMVCCLSSQAIAGQIWAGAGQIISGSGQGASVTLTLDINGNQATIVNGPSSGSIVSLNGGITAAGQWVFRGSDSELQVTLYTNSQQTVFYKLSPAR